jgi:hypothetical protein
MNPSTVAQNRTARLVREARTPAYSTDTRSAEASRRADLIRFAEDFTGPDFCHVCGRCTDHFGEHSDSQLIGFALSRKGRSFR